MVTATALRDGNTGAITETDTETDTGERKRNAGNQVLLSGGR